MYSNKCNISEDAYMFTINSSVLVWIAIALVPGFVFHKVFSLKSPTNRVEHEKNLIEYVVASTANFVFWCWLFLPYDDWPIEKWSVLRVVVVLLIVCFVSPTAMSIIWYKLRTGKSSLGWNRPSYSARLGVLS